MDLQDETKKMGTDLVEYQCNVFDGTLKVAHVNLRFECNYTERKHRVKYPSSVRYKEGYVACKENDKLNGKVKEIEDFVIPYYMKKAEEDLKVIKVS